MAKSAKPPKTPTAAPAVDSGPPVQFSGEGDAGLGPNQQRIGGLLVDTTGMDAKPPKAFKDTNPPPREKEPERKYGFDDVHAEVREAAKAAAGAPSGSDDVHAPEPEPEQAKAADVHDEPQPGEPPQSAGKTPSPFSDELVEQAEAIGFSVEDYPTPAALDRAIKAFDKSLLAIGGQVKPAEPSQPAAPVAKAPPPAPVQQPKQPATPDAITQLLAQAEKDFDPEFAAVVKGIHEFHDQRYQAMAAQLSQVGEHFQRQEVERATGQFDDWIEANDGVQKVLGSGRYSSLKPNSPSIADRQQVFQMAQTIAQHYAQFGLTVPRPALLYQKALAAAFPEKIAELERAKLTQRIRDTRTGQFLSKPTNQEPPKAPPRDPIASAVEKVTEQMRQFEVNAG